MDRIMTFGFLSGFFTLVFLGYRNRLKSRLPVIPVSLACCAVYGFLQGAWPLGFCLIAITAGEVRRWLRAGDAIQPRYKAFGADQPVILPGTESRLTRMFGST